MFSKQAIILLDHNILKGYVVPGVKDEAEISKAIAEYMAQIIAETSGRVFCYGDNVQGDQPQLSQTQSDAGN